MTKEDLLKKLKEIFTYDQISGNFTHNFSRGLRKAGDVVGTINKGGYLQFQISGKIYLAHRLAWLYMTGDWPEGMIDHKDLDRKNNSWSNLRDVPRKVNARNGAIRKNNSSGFRGVSWNKQENKWYAYISVDGKLKSLGRFLHKEDAILARMTAEKKYGYWVDRVCD